MSPTGKHSSTLVGLNHSFNNCQLSSKHYGASGDSLLFPFDGVSAEIFAKCRKLHIPRSFYKCQSLENLKTETFILFKLKPIQKHCGAKIDFLGECK